MRRRRYGGLFGQQLYGSEHWNALRADAAMARADLGESTFETWWARGEAMSTSELLDYIAGDGAPGDAPAAVTDDRSPAVVRRSPPAHDTVLLGSPSQREQEVAVLVADGLTNKEIAQRLVLSPRTVEGHVEHALRKLNLTRRTQMVAAISGSRVSPS